MKTTYNKLIGLLAAATIGLTLSSCGGGGGGGDDKPTTDNNTYYDEDDQDDVYVDKIGPTNLSGMSVTWGHSLQGVTGVTFTSSSTLKVTGTNITGSYTFNRDYDDAREATLVISIPDKGILRLVIEMEFQNSSYAQAESFNATLEGNNRYTMGGTSMYFN